MKIVIQTQYRENYGAHSWDGEGKCPQYWKNKGGETYVLIGLSVSEAINSQAIVDEVAPLIEYSNEASEEHIIGWELLDDCEPDGCDEWVHPWELSKQEDGSYIAARVVLNDEYGWFSRDIASHAEQYRMIPEGGREDYQDEFKYREAA
jgi:hypothetical protein